MGLICMDLIYIDVEYADFVWNINLRIWQGCLAIYVVQVRQVDVKKVLRAASNWS